MSIWTDYVRAYAKKNKMTYPQAMREAGPSYRKKYGSGVSGAGKKKKASSGSKTSKKMGGMVKKANPVRRRRIML